ncbi:MAG: 30S ribosomal protein S8 [Candidatus Aenigmatarchaeota archaeon]
MKHDIVSDVFSSIKNGDTYGKKEATVSSSDLVKNILMILQSHNFIGDFEFVDDKKGGKFKIQLLGKVNECNSIRPRFYVKKDGYEKFEKRLLPGSGFGFLIVSTTKGAMIHTEAREKGLGGVLLGYVY